jgi:ribosomal protein S18 acetylase RimI-like enzyme
MSALTLPRFHPLTLNPVIRFRPYRNTDPPHLVAVWRSQSPVSGLVQPMTAALFDEHVLGKSYFDRLGLVVATEDERPIGLVHAGFGPRSDATYIDPAIGTISLLLVEPREDRSQVADELLALAEDYLRGRGSQTIYTGTCDGRGPFYLGLIGGSELPGVPAADEFAVSLFSRHGYVESMPNTLFERDLAGLRPVIDRIQMQLRRRASVEAIFDPPPRSRWEACTLGGYSTIGYVIRRRDGGPDPGSVLYWNMDPLSAGRHARLAGMLDLSIETAARRQGWGKYLLSESLRHLASQGITAVQAQTTPDQPEAAELLRKLGFQEIATGMILKKTL